MGRLYTHGYEFFAPTTTVAFHLYSRDHRPTFLQSGQRPNDWEELREKSIKVVRAMTAMLIDKEHNGCANDLMVLNKRDYWLGE